METTKNNQNAEKYFNSGGRKYDIQDFVGAIADYTRALELNPELAEAYNNRGLAKASLQHYTGAITDFSKAIELNPDFQKRTITGDYRRLHYRTIREQLLIFLRL